MALLHHAAQHRAGQMECRRQVDGQHLVPFLVLHAHEEIVARHAGVVHEDIEPAQRGFRRRDQLVDRIEVGEVARQHGMVAAADLALGILERGDTRP